MALTSELAFRSIKILDIGYITILYFSVAFVLAIVFDKYYGAFDNEAEQHKSFFRKIIEIIGMVWIIGVACYIVRNVVERIPSPFHGLYGFDHLRLRELKQADVFVFIFLYFQFYLNDKLKALYDSIMKKRPASVKSADVHI